MIYILHILFTFMNLKTVHFKEESVFRLYDDGFEIGYLEYVEDSTSLIIKSTFIKPEYRRKGLGKSLVKTSEEYASSKGLNINSTCSYASSVSNDI